MEHQLSRSIDHTPTGTVLDGNDDGGGCGLLDNQGENSFKRYNSRDSNCTVIELRRYSDVAKKFSGRGLRLSKVEDCVRK